MLQSLRTSCQGLLFIEHCMCLAHTATGKEQGRVWMGRGSFQKKKTFYKQMTRRHWILMFKNGSRKINTYQKEQHRNKKEIEQKQEIEK